MAKAPDAAVAADAPVRPGSWRAWAAAVRPPSLLVALSPVLVGASFGYARSGRFNAVAAALVLLAALLMQVVTNLQNDVGYTVRGGDSGRHAGTRNGLPRATANGWLSVAGVRTAIVVVALLATVVGCVLVAWRGWPVLVIGSASLLAALAYMGGPRPIAYTPFGELTVFVFFGLVAVCGSDWVLSGAVGAASVSAAVAIGSLAAAALAVNNHRDIAHDGGVGRRTFAVVFGAGASRRLFGVLQLGPLLLLPSMAIQAQSPWLALPLLLLPEALMLQRRFVRCSSGAAYTAVLLRSFRLELGYAVLLSAGALAARLAG